MSRLETLETADPCAEPVNCATTAGREVRQSQTRSVSASLRKAVKRFVAWIDRVDADGQQFWN